MSRWQEFEAPFIRFVEFIFPRITRWCGLDDNNDWTLFSFLSQIQRGTPKYVLLGEHDLSNDKNDSPLQVEIAQKFPHPQFKRSSKYYDIALLKMALRITLSPYIRPACLPDHFQYPNEHAVATGWGRTDYRGQTSQVLQKVVLELFTERECNATYADAARTNQLRFGIIPAQQFCAGSHTEKKDTCQVRQNEAEMPWWPMVKCVPINY